ncbi:TPA: LPXTG cell wall anchor domain-containing protein, partial [Streptococcus suis]|nr:LPXTG cell wall anchor domain-containing protein [Streptococcus suis]
FTGWDKTNHVINKADGHFVGTWTFTPSTLVEKPAKVVHEFVSGTPGKELPQEVKDLLPSGFDTKFDETVEPKQPTENAVKVSDGTWTFTSYDENSKVVNEAEEKFVGTWTFTPSTLVEKPAKVVHEFVSGTQGKELPQEVKDLLPSGFDTKFDETVEPKQPTENAVKVSDGTWTFTSYDETSKVVNEAVEKFIGTWTFTPSTLVEKPAKVVHEFVSGTPDKELPQEVKDLLPSGFDTKFDETVEPKQPTETTVKVSDGTWTFTSYDETSKVVNEAEEKFVGTWTFTPSTDGGTTPPTDGGVNPPTDGGTTPPTDGGVNPPTDGGTTPPTDGGVNSPTDGGVNPPTDGGTTPPTPPTGTITVTPKAGPSQLPNTGEASTSPLYGVLSLVTGLAGLFGLVKKKKEVDQ